MTRRQGSTANAEDAAGENEIEPAYHADVPWPEECDLLVCCAHIIVTECGSCWPISILVSSFRDDWQAAHTWPQIAIMAIVERGLISSSSFVIKCPTVANSPSLSLSLWSYATIPA